MQKLSTRIAKAHIEETMFKAFLKDMGITREQFLDVVDEFEFNWDPETEQFTGIGISIQSVHALAQITDKLKGMDKIGDA